MLYESFFVSISHRLWLMVSHHEQGLVTMRRYESAWVNMSHYESLWVKYTSYHMMWLILHAYFIIYCSKYWWVLYVILVWVMLMTLYVLYSVKNVISLSYFLYVIIVLIYIDWYYFHIFESHFKKIQSSKTPHNYSRPFVDFRSGARFVNLPQMTIEWWSFTKEFAIFQKHNIDVTCVIMVRKLNKLLKVMHLGWFSNYLTVAS